MTSDVVEKVANAVLYEGYMLYPYRPSAVKNRQRFNFGVLYPRDYCEAQTGSDSWWMRTECLAVENPLTAIDVKIRFLQMVETEKGSEGRERDVGVTGALEALVAQPVVKPFAFDESIVGEVKLSAARVRERLYKISVCVRNSVGASSLTRDVALLRSLLSVHSILQVENGEFVSLMDPPDEFRTAAAACNNVGTWPVLVGEEGRRGTLLSAPIILYDYPQIAPESPGDLFDGTEIDEILALRILTLTDQEKVEVRNSDDRARLILERTEMMPPEHFQKLHGAMRGLPPHSEGAQ